jgi:sterol desaturase/sphingolipid hydroxylase (fatty acid hydroxylase superfamily)
LEAKAAAAAEGMDAAADGTGEADGRLSFLRAILYPALLLGPLMLLWGLLEAGAGLHWAPYLAVAFGGPVILLAERLVPYRPDWRPDRRDLWNDGLYLVAVQILLSLALGWATVLAAQAWLSGSGLTLALWPTHWPIWAQLVLKVGVGDFFRYWLHRAAHSWPALWRIHAVHHAPGKLYTTNVFRFHPAEKALQFLCDSAPFILAGAGPELLAYYLVFYAMSGLLQHANCDVRLGWLNYLISGPEVHRWHHSRTIAESNANYAHSFVVWDLLLGTYFRPRDASVRALGLLHADYPRGFWRQLAAPFQRRIRP